MEDSTQTPVAETPAATVEQPATPVAPVAAEAAPAVQPAPQPATPADQPAANETPTTTTGTVVPPSGDSSVLAGLSTPVLVGIGVAVVAVIVVAIILLGKRGGKSAKGSTGSGAAPAKSNGDVVEIYVGNLSYDMTEAQFRKEFEKFGVVKLARIIGHRTSGKSKGYGFVEMPHRKEALVAIKALNNRDIMGRKLRVNEARNGNREE